MGKELPLTSSLPPCLGQATSSLLQPISGQALAVTLSREAKDEGGGQDIPGASLVMGGISVETRGGPYPDDYQGSQTSLSPHPASPSHAFLALRAVRKPGKGPPLVTKVSRKRQRLGDSGNIPE